MNYSNILNKNNNDEIDKVNRLIDCFFQNDINTINESDTQSIEDKNLVLTDQFPLLKLTQNIDINTDELYNFSLQSDFEKYSLQSIASEYLSNLNTSCDLVIDIEKMKSTPQKHDFSNINDSCVISEKKLLGENAIIIPKISINRTNYQCIKKTSKISSLLFKRIKIEKTLLLNDFDIKDQRKIVTSVKIQRKKY